MLAAEKMRDFGMKALSERIKDRDLKTIYRWRQSIEDGEGIRDQNKARLIEATAGSAHAITWADFLPQLERAA